MTEQRRLFDCIDYQLQKFPLDDMLAAKVGSDWIKYSTAEVKKITSQLAAGLINLGISGNDNTDEGADKIAILSNNRPEWLFVDLAVQQTGAVLVPVYPTTNPNELQFILNDALVKFIFVSSQDLLDKVNSIKSFVPTLKNVYCFDDIEKTNHWSSISLLATNENMQELEKRKTTISEENIATIIYTSGTTGTPKGVMLTHKNIVSCIKFSKESFPFSDAPGSKALSFLPLNHIFEKSVSYIYLFSGIAIYYAQSLDTIGDNLREVKPDCFTTVPRLLEKVYERFLSAGQQLTGLKKKIYFWAIDLAEKYDNRVNGGFLYNIKLSIADKIVFKKWREALGNNLKYVITGGAACQEKLLRLFNAALIPLYEGYGPTENSPVICVNRQEKNGLYIGTVGPPINHIEVKIADDGEICVKGDTVMKGYYKRPDLTAETIIDNWLHTGDIGVWIENKFIKITDRKKELFKTSGGKYVAPQPIENTLKGDPLIEQALIVGPERKFVGALIVPSFNFLSQWMKEQNIPFTTNENAIKNAAVLKKYKSIVEKINENFNHVEQIKKFELLSKEWSIETGEMTPKMSLKRKIIMEKYKDAIERIYA